MWFMLTVVGRIRSRGQLLVLLSCSTRSTRPRFQASRLQLQLGRQTQQQHRKWPVRVSPAPHTPVGPSDIPPRSPKRAPRANAAEMASMSPRLPSPPPPAEIQLGPKSPGLSAMADEETQQMEQTLLNANSKRRIHPGTKSADMAAGPPLVPLSEVRAPCRDNALASQIF